MAKIKRATIDRVVRECIADVGKYRYILRAEIGGCARIERREIARLNTLNRFGPQWETVARYDPEADRWTIEK